MYPCAKKARMDYSNDVFQMSPNANIYPKNYFDLGENVFYRCEFI